MSVLLSAITTPLPSSKSLREKFELKEMSELKSHSTFIFKSEVSIGEELGFHKNSFIELNRSLLHHYDLETQQVITVHFSTLQPDGILLWQGKVSGFHFMLFLVAKLLYNSLWLSVSQSVRPSVSQ